MQYRVAVKDGVKSPPPEKGDSPMRPGCVLSIVHFPTVSTVVIGQPHPPNQPVRLAVSFSCGCFSRARTSSRLTAMERSGRRFISI
jgi:hypothetical protein